MAPDIDTLGTPAPQGTPDETKAATQAAPQNQPAATVAPVEPTPHKWAGKYNSPEEMEKGLIELERFLGKRVDADTLRQQLGLFETEPKPQPKEPQQTQQVQQAQPQVQQQVQQQIQQNAGVYANAVGQLVRSGWDPADALAHVISNMSAQVAQDHANKIAEAKVRDLMENELAPVLQAFAAQYADVVKTKWQSDTERAWSDIATDFRDAEDPQIKTTIKELLKDPASRAFKQVLEDPRSTVADKKMVFRSLYLNAKNQQSGDIASQAAAAGAKQEQSRQRQAAAATVESTSGKSSVTDEPKLDELAQYKKKIQEQILGAKDPR